MSDHSCDYVLGQLQTALRFKGAAPVLVVLSFVVSPGLIGMLLAVLAAAFTPYMLVQLWRARWIRVIMVFAVLVIGPALWAWLSEPSSNMGILVRYMVPLVLFYLYVWGLNLAIGSRLAERERARMFGFGAE